MDPARSLGRVLALLALLSLSSLAPAAERAANDPRVVAVVMLDTEPLATYRGGLRGLAAPGAVAPGAARLDVHSRAATAYLGHLDRRFAIFEAAAITAIPDAVPLYRYGVVLGGVALQVHESDLARLAAMPGVRRVLRDEPAAPDTDKSPKFVAAPKLWKQVGGPASAGEGVVIGVLDTGIWPEHPSFADPDPSGKPYPPPPATWRGGAGPYCQPPTDASPPLPCNNKLIGARHFLAAFKSNVGLRAGEFDSARDQAGHGTHTSSTAGGNRGVPATVLGVFRGVVSGIAPRAHVAMYRVCGISETGGCFGADSAAAVQQAILDGVDAINFSIGGGTNPYSDVASLAFRDAYAAGVFVSCSAGNSGPADNTVGHREPWVATVAVTTQKRQFASQMTLKGDQTGKLKLDGASITGGFAGALPLVNAADLGDPACAVPFAPNSVSGKVVACQRGVTATRTIKSLNVSQGGAAAMLLFDQPGFTGAFNEAHFVPTLHIDRPASDQLIAFLAANSTITAKFSGAKAFNGKADVLADFSSRGGSGQILGVSKPDLAAPGFEILAGHTPATLLNPEDKKGELFQVISGTSMSSPHVAAAGALLHQVHPDWTPGQIHSALMTTALTKKLFREDGTTPAGPFEVGTGRLDMARAANPGLTFDATRDDFVAHQADLWTVNYPSLYVPQMPATLTVSRTVHSELAKSTKLKISVIAPADLAVSVPAELVIGAAAAVSFDIDIDASAVPSGQVRHATLLIGKGKNLVRFPITIVRS